jgi:hypothetical protein
MIRVKENQDLSKDPISGAIVNTNIGAYENAIRTHNLTKEREARMESLEDDINTIKNMVDDIKDLLSAFKQDNKSE